MEQYSIAKNREHKWVVTVEGEDVMICDRKSDAIKATKDATELLRKDARSR
jgi:hypothetical protein